MKRTAVPRLLLLSLLVTGCPRQVPPLALPGGKAAPATPKEPLPQRRDGISLSPEFANVNQSTESIFDSVSKLVDADILHNKLVESALGITLQFDATHSTHAYDFYRYESDKQSLSAGMINRADFRVPRSAKKEGNELLYIDLKSNRYLNDSAVIEYYGQPLQVVASTPQERAVTGIAVTYAYLLGKRRVSFSFSDVPSNVLLSIALERRH